MPEFSVKEPSIINISASSHFFNLEKRDEGSSNHLTFSKFFTMFCNIKKPIFEEKFEATILQSAAFHMLKPMLSQGETLEFRR